MPGRSMHSLSFAFRFVRWGNDEEVLLVSRFSVKIADRKLISEPLAPARQAEVDRSHYLVTGAVLSLHIDVLPAQRCTNAPAMLVKEAVLSRFAIDGVARFFKALMDRATSAMLSPRRPWTDPSHDASSQLSVELL